MNALEITGLCKTYPDFTLDNLNLTLPSGCVMGLVGENGAGKSTTIKLILNMLRRDAGQVSVLGMDNLTYDRRIKEEVGVVLDDVGFPGCLTPKQIGNILRRTYQNWNDDTYAQLLKRLGLPTDKAFDAFSRGHENEARHWPVAMSHAPKLLLLDEATSGLDPVVRDRGSYLVRRIHARRKTMRCSFLRILSATLKRFAIMSRFCTRANFWLCEEKDALLEKIRCDSLVPPSSSKPYRKVRCTGSSVPHTAWKRS